ncbi:hypothetical protein QJS66_01425 [Kocuria rhizophila]|nr:hypothetical protein QJS66_01425 [Kocuria rhizophila]
MPELTLLNPRPPTRTSGLSWTCPPDRPVPPTRETPERPAHEPPRHRSRRTPPHGDHGRNPRIHLELLCVGVGPFGLGLACLADPLADVRAAFLDAALLLRLAPRAALRGRPPCRSRSSRTW